MEWMSDDANGVPFFLLTELLDRLHRVQVVLYTTDLYGRGVEMPTLLRPATAVKGEPTLRFGMLMSRRGGLTSPEQRTTRSEMDFSPIP